MPLPLTPEVESTIKTLSKLKYSYSQIIKHLKSWGHSVSKKGITNVLKNRGKKRQALAEGPTPPPRRSRRKVLTQAVLRKIDLVTSKDNPPTQRQIARQVKVSQSSVNRAIKILNKKVRRKPRVHQLTEKHKKNRRLTCKQFYKNYLTHDRSEYLVTLDEALLVPNLT